MQKTALAFIMFCFLAALACNGLAPAAPTPTAPLPTTATPLSPVATEAEAITAASPTPAATASATEPATPEPATPTPASTETPTAEPTPTELPIETYIAYVQNRELLVTHVIGGQPLDTRQYTDSAAANDFVSRVGWSPSGQFLTFLMRTPDSFHHLFFVNSLDSSPPLDLGIATAWAWSADSRLLAFEHEYELWLYSLDSGQSRRLTTHLGTDWLWGQPIFAPAGDALIAAGTVTDEIDRNGNTVYKLYRVPLDGSAANAYPTTNMPSITGEISGQLPSALSLSPDGQTLAVVTSTHVDACGTFTHYYVANPDGSDWRDLPLASLAAIANPDQQLYFFGDSLVWNLESNGLWLNGLVRDCGNFPNDNVAGPQISYVTLDGREHEIIPGEFSNLSLDRTGQLLGVLNLAFFTPHVQILGRDGHLVLDLGEGELAVLQP